MLDDLLPLTFECTLMRLVALAAGGGTLSASDVEQDEHLARDHQLTSAAARMLAESAAVGAETDAEAEGWFPFKRVTLAELPSPSVEEEVSARPRSGRAGR